MLSVSCDTLSAPLYFRVMKNLLFSVLTLGTMSLASAAEVQLEYHNAPYDDEGNLNFEAGASENLGVWATGVSFVLQPWSDWVPTDPEDPERDGTWSYDATISGEEEFELPDTLKLERFTLLAVDTENQAASGVWGLVMDAEGVVQAASHVDFSGSGSITFDFLEAAPELNMFSAYTLTFVLSDDTLENLGVSVGDTYAGNGHKMFVHAAAVEAEGTEDEYIVYTANEHLDYCYVDDSGDVILSAPAVYIVAKADAIPEPTSATLSLLALCGLCARRRRKRF